MSERNDGGPAFPQLEAFVDAKGERPVYTTYDGMTLRDYFAAKAMQGCCARAIVTGAEVEFAEAAYAVADAMLAERSK